MKSPHLIIILYFLLVISCQGQNTNSITGNDFDLGNDLATFYENSELTGYKSKDYYPKGILELGMIGYNIHLPQDKPIQVLTKHVDNAYIKNSYSNQISLEEVIIPDTASNTCTGFYITYGFKQNVLKVKHESFSEPDTIGVGDVFIPAVPLAFVEQLEKKLTTKYGSPKEVNLFDYIYTSQSGFQISDINPNGIGDAKGVSLKWQTANFDILLNCTLMDMNKMLFSKTEKKLLIMYYEVHNPEGSGSYNMRFKDDDICASHATIKIIYK